MLKSCNTQYCVHTVVNNVKLIYVQGERHQNKSDHEAHDF